jgi:glycosyltransferase involved in cell wall biosynthesis
MAVENTYGIFISYSPNVNLGSEGLGRYMGAFVKSVAERGQTKLVIAAPSWSRKPLHKFLREMDVPESAFSIIGPKAPPILVLYFWFAAWRKRSRKSRPKHWRFWNWQFWRRLFPRYEVAKLVRLFAGSRNPMVFLVGLLFLTIFGLGGLVLLLIQQLLVLPYSLAVLVCRKDMRLKSFSALRRKVAGALKRERTARSRHSIVTYLYTAMHEQETTLLVQMANGRTDVEAWYVPTAFWPAVSALKRPRLVCVPDVVSTEFPIGFSEVDGAAVMRVYSEISKTIEGKSDFVTYSEHIKQKILVERFGVLPSAVSVVPHAPSSLEEKISVSGFSDNASATRSLSRVYLKSALAKVTGPVHDGFSSAAQFSYIFYASQFRPSKNILSFLEAYKYLLRRKFVQHKLVLTAHGDTSALRRFIVENNLERDVLCLHDLSEIELAACYSCADLAVCPTLSEGGMPFTFTEAVSVGTPVVMGDIEVTREILVDPGLRQATLFDPYSSRAIADKIEWALSNLDDLCAKQRKFYDDVLSKRTWNDVVGEHISIMERIAARERGIVATDSPRRLAS